MRILDSSVFVLVWFVYVLQCKCDAANDGCDSASKSEIFSLKRKLFCSYDTEVRPVKNQTTTTNVSTHLWVKSVFFHQDNSVLEIHSWIVWIWKDEHLTWDKNEFNGLESMNILSSEVWSPDVTATRYSRTDHTIVTRIPETSCLLLSDGEIRCVAPTQTTAICKVDTSRWPFDLCKCRMRMGSWTNSADELNITMDEKGISTLDYKENREWELLKVNASRREIRLPNISYVSISYSFEMKRHPGGHASSVVTPSIVLAVMTLVSFWLDPARPCRIGLICSNIICHCLFLFLLSWLLPKNGNDTPIIVTFFRDSLLLAGISLLVSICTGRMIKAARAPPTLIASISNAAMSSSYLQFCLVWQTNPKSVAAVLETGVAKEDKEVIGPPLKTNSWCVFAVLLDRFFFVVFTLTLFILLCAYIP